MGWDGGGLWCWVVSGGCGMAWGQTGFSVTHPPCPTMPTIMVVYRGAYPGLISYLMEGAGGRKTPTGWQGGRRGVFHDERSWQRSCRVPERHPWGSCSVYKRKKAPNAVPGRAGSLCKSWQRGRRCGNPTGCQRGAIAFDFSPVCSAAFMQRGSGARARDSCTLNSSVSLSRINRT